LSNVDATHILETLKDLDPETTLFIISSKTFTTAETLCNALTAKEWLLSQATADGDVIIPHHFLAVTAKSERAVDFGILPKNIFPFWDFVGGRYSLWSSIGLSIAIAIGMDNFRKLLHGAHAMDQHFRSAEIEQNMPVILALLGILNINGLGLSTQAVIPYDQYLSLLPSFLQQLEMESNGKCVKIDGTKVNYKTAPVLWGSVGTNGQHAFHQLLMQGTEVVPVDFILSVESHNPVEDHHMLLFANCLAQSQALMNGKSKEEAIDELLASGLPASEAKSLAPHKVIAGNVPSNTILMQKLTPETLGALIALYEHKVFVQGVIWQINSFDQWGVELGKKLANNLVPKLQDKKSGLSELDSSTKNLILHWRNRG
jgi:glucose-6-phosphate isomerase